MTALADVTIDGNGHVLAAFDALQLTPQPARAEIVVFFADRRSPNPRDHKCQALAIPRRMFDRCAEGLKDPHRHVLRWDSYDGLVCECGLLVTGESLKAAGFVRPWGNPARESRLGDRCGDLQKERDEARARVGELELELRRLKRESRP